MLCCMQLGYPALCSSELWSTARLRAFVSISFVAETPGQDKVLPLGMTQPQHSYECCIFEVDWDYLPSWDADCRWSTFAVVERTSEVASNHSSVILAIMKIVVGSNWIGVVTFHLLKRIAFPGKWKIGLSHQTLFSLLASSHISHRKRVRPMRLQEEGVQGYRVALFWWTDLLKGTYMIRNIGQFCEDLIQTRGLHGAFVSHRDTLKGLCQSEVGSHDN